MCGRNVFHMEIRALIPESDVFISPWCLARHYRFCRIADFG
jgi:hypothetical protein